MVKKETFGGVAILTVFIGIIVIVLTWPILQIQTKNLISENNKLTLTTSVWNKGGDISGFSLITPNVCIYYSLSNNLTCSHKGYDDYSDCSIGICSKVSPGDLSSEDLLTITTPNQKTNFSFNISTFGTLGFIPVARDSKSIFCQLNSSIQKYDCQ